MLPTLLWLVSLQIQDPAPVQPPCIGTIQTPTLEVLAFTRYLAQGGVGLVAFRSRGATRVGVNAGGLFFPAFPTGPQDSVVLVALLALLTAKALDFGLLGIWLETGSAISGHALHHLPLAAAVGWLAWRVARLARDTAASRRSTSVISAG